MEDLRSIPGLGRCPGGGHGNPLQYSCLENLHEQTSPVGYSPWGLKVRHSWVTKHNTYYSFPKFLKITLLTVKQISQWIVIPKEACVPWPLTHLHTIPSPFLLASSAGALVYVHHLSPLYTFTSFFLVLTACWRFSKPLYLLDFIDLYFHFISATQRYRYAWDVELI